MSYIPLQYPMEQLYGKYVFLGYYKVIVNFNTFRNYCNFHFFQLNTKWIVIVSTSKSIPMKTTAVRSGGPRLKPEKGIKWLVLEKLSLHQPPHIIFNKII